MASSRRADAIIEGRRESAGAWGVHSAGRPRGEGEGTERGCFQKSFQPQALSINAPPQSTSHRAACSPQPSSRPLLGEL